MSTEINMQHASVTEYGLNFQANQSTFVAGNNLNISVVNNVNNRSESSILTHLMNVLSPVTSACHDSYSAKQRSECFQGTRVQVLNDIKAWIHAESHQASIYVLDGVAGIGKSTIAQTIAAKAAALGLLGGSFFFSRDEELRKIAKHFFPTIAYQLACYNDEFATSINLSLEKNPDALAKRLDQQMSLLFLEPLEHLLLRKTKPTLLIVDALDECEEDNAEKLLSLLGQHVHGMKGLKILITMRPEVHLRGVLDEDKNNERFRLHEVEDSIVHSDIRRYLQSRLSQEEISKVFHNRRMLWQPTEKDMDMLCGICGTLFIIAATATKFILDRKRMNPEKQLARLLDGISGSASSGSKYTHILDETYVSVILSGQSDLDDSDDDWFRDLNKILGALIALANPIPCNALASLLDMNWEDIEATLSPLHSLVAPSGSGETMIFRIHHKSFPDFITNRELIQQVLEGRKSGKHQGHDLLLWVNLSDQHLRLAKACLCIMNRDLKRNMMGIKKEDWYKDKGNIPHGISWSISPDLAYASLHWASHLRSADGLDKDTDLQNYVDVWASKHILAWMEVMVVLNCVTGIYGTLENVIKSLKCITDSAWTERARLQELLSDAFKFVQHGSEIMKLSPMHIYKSCLPFIPTDTTFGQTYRERAMVKIAFGAGTRWDPLVAVLIGHSGEVDCVSFSNDGYRLASGSQDETVQLWDGMTGAHVSTFTGHSGWVRSVAFSNDGSQLASGSDDETIQLWDANTGALISIIDPHSDLALSVAFSRDGSQLASVSGDKIHLWNAKTGAHISTLPSYSNLVFSIAFSGNGHILACGSMDPKIRLWNTNTGALVFILAGHSDFVKSVAFSSDGSRLASGSVDQTIRLWDTTMGVHISTLTGHTDSVNSVAFSSNNSQLASGSNDGTVRIWDAKTGAHVSTLTGHSYGVSSVSFSSDGTRLASASGDYTVRLWDSMQATHASAPIGHVQLVRSIAFSNDGSLLASASYDKTIRLWAIDSGTCKYTLAGHSDYVNSVTFSSDGSLLASGSNDETVRLWNVETGAHTLTLSGHSDHVDSVVFSSDNSQLASGSHDTTVRLWDVKTGANIFTLLGHTSYVVSLVFASDGSQLASGSVDRTIRLWDAKMGAHILTLSHSDPLKSVAFCCNNSLLVTGSEYGTIQFLDAKAAMHVFTLNTPWTLRSTPIIVPLRDDSKLCNQLISRSGWLMEHENQGNRTHILALIVRETPSISGLVIASLPSKMEGNLEGDSEVSLLCWFPPDMTVTSFAADQVNSKLAVGCKSGRVMVLDFSSDNPHFDF